MKDNKKNKQSDWQKRFSAAFTGEDMGIKKPKTINGQDQSKEAKEKRRKSRNARRK